MIFDSYETVLQCIYIFVLSWKLKACRNLAIYDMQVDRTNVQKWYVVHVHESTGNANDDKRELEKSRSQSF